jgi:hypothetical protein
MKIVSLSVLFFTLCSVSFGQCDFATQNEINITYKTLNSLINYQVSNSEPDQAYPILLTLDQINEICSLLPQDKKLLLQKKKSYKPGLDKFRSCIMRSGSDSPPPNPKQQHSAFPTVYHNNS